MTRTDEITASTCRHCARAIVHTEDGWIDPQATGDDAIWRETCDEHDTREANHEPRTPTVQDLAGQLAAAFEYRTRDNGEGFYSLRNGSPDWMSDAIFEAHGDAMPDDFIYQVCAATAEALEYVDESNEIETADDVDDTLHEVADGAVPVYNSDRLRWLSSNLYHAGICDEIAEERGEEGGIFDRIGWGMYEVARQAAYALTAALCKLADEIKEEAGE